jgi:hypothetical protein
MADYSAILSGIGYDSDDILYKLEEGTMDYLNITNEKFKMVNSRSWWYGSSHQFSSDIESPVLRAGNFCFIKKWENNE